MQLIICKYGSKEEVYYALGNISNSIFVAEYKTSDKVTLVAGYTYTEFEDYLINYYTLGLKFALKQ